MSKPPTNTETNNGEGEADAKPVMGRPPHVPTDDNRDKVRHLSKIGMRYTEIAWMIGVSQPTLSKYYLQELMEGSTHGQQQVLETLYSMATDGKHQAATIFYAKTRCGICQPRNSAPGRPELDDDHDPEIPPSGSLLDRFEAMVNAAPPHKPRQP